MEEERIQLIVQAIAQGFDTAFNGVKGGAGAFLALSAAVKTDANGALQAFGVNLAALNSPLTALASGMKASIDETVQWAGTIDKLSRASGEGAEETSKMAVVLGDYGINVDSLDKVVKTFTKNGLQFNLETIKKLASEYQAIQDPVKRDEFAFKNFGRSGLEMNEILSKTPAELTAVGDAAMYSGKIMNEQGVEAIQQFGVKTAQLNDKLDGLKIAVGAPLVDVLSNAIDGFKGVTAVSNVLGISILQKTGIITADEAAARANAAAHGDLFAVYHNVDVAAKLLGSDAALVTSVEVKAIPVHYENANAIQQLGVQVVNMTDGEIKAGQAIMDATQAAADQAAQLAVNAGLSGTITQAENAYSDTISGNAKDIAKLTAELAKLNAANGQVVTATNNSAYSTDQLDLANNKVLIGSERFQIAQQKLAQAHQGAKESADAYATRLLSLQVAVQSAGDSWQQAQMNLDKMTGAVDQNGTYIVDNTKKIAEDQAALDALNAKNAEAQAAIAKTTGEFILQNLAMQAAPEAQLAIAHSLGLIDDASYNLALRVQGLTKDWDLNGNGMIDAGAEADGLAGALHNTQMGVEAAAGALPPLAGHIDTVATAAHNAHSELDGMVVAEDSLHDKLITIETKYINSTYGNGGPGYTGDGSGGGNGGGGGYTNPAAPTAAAGRDMIVPDRYTNDSYGVMAQAGERVIVIPPGQPGNGGGPLGSLASGGGGSATPGGGDTIIINDRAAAALYLERKRAERLAGMERRI